MRNDLLELGVLAVVVALLAYGSFWSRSPRVNLAAQVSMIVLVIFAGFAVWAVYEFVTNFTIPAM